MGRPFIEVYGLREVVDQGGSVYLGRVTTGPDGHLALQVEKSFGAPPAQNPTPLHLEQAPVVRHPLESPRGRLLRGGRPGPPTGRVLVVRTVCDAVLEASDANLRRVEVLFGQRRLEPRAQDLADPDLAPLARQALEASGRWHTADLLRASPEFLRRTFSEAGVDEQRELLLAVAATEAVELRRALLELALRQRDERLLPHVAALAAEEPGRLWQGVQVWFAVGDGEGKPRPDLSPLADLYARHAFSRVGTLAPAEVLPRLSPEATVRLARRLLEDAAREPHSELDLPRLELATTVVARAPDAALLDAVLAVDPRQRPYFALHEAAFTAVLRMLTTLVTAHPELGARAAAAVEALREAHMPAKADALAAWEARREGA